MENYNK